MSGYMRERLVRKVPRQRGFANRQWQRKKSRLEMGREAEKSLPARLCPCKSSLLFLRGEMVVGDVVRERVKPCQTTTRPGHVTRLNVSVTIGTSAAAQD